MKQIKLRWRMWKTYTSNIDKTVHAVIVALYLILVAALLIDFSWLNILVIVGYTVIAYALIMKDVWHNAYHRTEQLRALGWHVTSALHEHTFIHITKADGIYYIQPEHVGEHPDDLDGEVFTEEIVIRRGIDSDGTDITAYRIPDELDEVVAVGMLETTKQQYLYDAMEKDK